MKVKATRFMRKPFVSKGYEVTETNMDALAQWCGGSVIREEGRTPFVRVPVSRSNNERQTRAYTGSWIVVSIFDDQRHFKVYKLEWLLRSFFELTTWNGDEVDDELEMDGAAEHKCCSHHHGGITIVPAQPVPSPATIFRAPRAQ